MDSAWNILLLLFSIRSSYAFLFDTKPVDCVTSQWSKWEGPRNGGSYESFRTILVPPANNGNSCPTALSKSVFVPGTMARVVRTAQQIDTHFLRRSTAYGMRRNSARGQTRDLLIIIDSSGSIGQTAFHQAAQDIAELIELLCPAKDPFHSSQIVYQQAAVITFASTANEIFDFDDMHPTSVLTSAIRNLQYTSGGTRTDLAFQKAIQMFTGTAKGARHDPGVKKEVLIITDGMSNQPQLAIAAARALKNTRFSPLNDSVEVFGLVIDANSSNNAEVQQYTSAPVANHLFALKSYNELGQLVAVVRKLAQTGPCVAIQGR